MHEFKKLIHNSFQEPPVCPVGIKYDNFTEKLEANALKCS